MRDKFGLGSVEPEGFFIWEYRHTALDAILAMQEMLSVAQPGTELVITTYTREDFEELCELNTNSPDPLMIPFGLVEDPPEEPA